MKHDESRTKRMSDQSDAAIREFRMRTARSLKEQGDRLEKSLRVARSRRRDESVPFLESRGWKKSGHKFLSPYNNLPESLPAAMKCERRKDTDDLKRVSLIASEELQMALDEADRLRGLLRDTQPKEPSHNDEMHQTEAECYRVQSNRVFDNFSLGHRKLTFGFCISKTDGDGYSDDMGMWANDDIDDPIRMISVCIHESLHELYPHLTEAEVHCAGDDISDLIARVFAVKAESRLPKLLTIAECRRRKKEATPESVPTDSVYTTTDQDRSPGL